MEPIWEGLKLARYLRADVYWTRSHHWQVGQTWDHVSMPAYVLWVVQQGALEVTLDGRAYLLKAGDVWLHAPAKRRTIRVLQDATWLSLGMVATLYEDLDALAPLAPAQWKPRSGTRLESWLRELIVAGENSTLNVLVCDGLARAIVGWCWEEQGKDFMHYVHHQVPPWMGHVLEAMRRAPETTIEQHIRNSGYSAAQFRRNFHRILGCSPREYLQRHRLETARRLLEVSDESIAEVAARSGFVSPAHFTRIFSRAFDLSPSQYRHFARQPKM